MDVIAIVGLGYVGLPLAVAFGGLRPTIGYDLSAKKIGDYRHYIDSSGQVSSDDLRAATGLTFTTDPADLAPSDYIIVAVPTPIDAARQPDLSPLINACHSIGRHMKPGVTVIFESTVYPGATEEVCIPALEQASGMRWQHDFNVGYSPERINPGDKEHTLTNTVKVMAGDNQATLEKITRLYASVVQAGVHPVSSIKVAEAAKVIENTQRDLNIALMNELAIIFNMMGIDTTEVLEAAGSKWNFLPFRPGLVGGHCIGVDPYYLTHKAERLGYHPQVILAGRRINDGMAAFVAQQTVKQLISAGGPVKAAKVIVLGITFKENCSDLRNSKVVGLVRELQDFGCDVSVHDPVADPQNAAHEYGLALASWDDLPQADAMVAAVSHREYLTMSQSELLAKLKPGGVFVDVKSVHDAVSIEAAGYRLWRL